MKCHNDQGQEPKQYVHHCAYCGGHQVIGAKKWRWKLWGYRLAILLGLGWGSYMITNDSWDALARHGVAVIFGMLLGGIWLLVDERLKEKELL